MPERLVELSLARPNNAWRNAPICLA